MNYDFAKLKSRSEEIKEWFKKETLSLRTGRATPSLVEDILVDSYGSRTPIKHLASISAEDARTLRIAPWDASVLPSIEKAIIASNIGAQPIADKQTIRLSLPELTDERRKALIKMLSQILEEARVSLRKERDEVWKDIQDKEKDGQMSEDEKFRFKDEMQKIIDNTSVDLENLSKKKEGEITG